MPSPAEIVKNAEEAVERLKTTCDKNHAGHNALGQGQLDVQKKFPTILYVPTIYGDSRRLDDALDLLVIYHAMLNRHKQGLTLDEMSPDNRLQLLSELIELCRDPSMSVTVFNSLISALDQLIQLVKKDIGDRS